MYLNPYHPLTSKRIRGDGSIVNTELSVKEVFEGSGNLTKSFAEPMRMFFISNDGADLITFTINGITVKVFQGEGFAEEFDPFTQVVITTTSDYRAYVKG